MSTARIVLPFTVDATSLASTNVPEAAPADYASGTTYAADALVSVTTGSTSVVYRSLQAGNVGHAPASSPTWWKLVATTYQAWSSGTTYGLGDRVIDAAAHRTYESLAAANLNHALTDKGWWADVGPTNRWAMFDQINGTATSANEQIAVVVTAGTRIDSVVLLGLVASSVTISATTATAGTVYNKTFSLQDTTGVNGWYAYWYAPIVNRTELPITDLPNLTGMTITITINGTGTVACGSCIIGKTRELGATIYGAKVGIVDRSRKDADDFGNYVVVERPYSKRASLSIVMTGATMGEVASKVDALNQQLAAIRATPVVWIGAEEYTSTVIFGFFRSFDLEIAYPLQSNLTLEIEGLT